MRRVFKTRQFSKWMRKTDLTDTALCQAVQEMVSGLVDADLGGDVLKKRVALPGRGKRGGVRTLTVHYRRFAMSTKAKPKPQAASRLLGTVYETAADLERLGFIDKRKMQKLEALCMEPIATYDSAQIRALREQLNLSQTVMASVLNTSASTVRKWEIGEKRPSGPSLKLLNLLDRKGLDALL